MAFTSLQDNNPSINRSRLPLSAWVGLSAAALLALLSIAIHNNLTASQDQAVLDWVAGWDLSGLSAFFSVVSFLTDNWPFMALTIAGLAFLMLLGMTREALAFAVVAIVIGVSAFLADLGLGVAVGRSRPLAEGLSFPSGHAFGSVFLGFLAFLAVHYRLKKRLLIPLLSAIAALLLATGVARVHQQAHWPSDAAAGYLLGILWLLLLVPLFLRLQRATWLSSKKLGEDLTALSCESCRVARSIASVVLLDPQKGTATKVYRPPPLVRMLYWLSYQAKFPYESNTAALQVAVFRREIAALLTRYKFGKDLVAHATAVNCAHGKCSFVTEFVPGEQAKNDEPAQRFLSQVSEVFAEAGLSIWQVNPRNPHAHTNIIQTLEGDFKVIDLESAVVTLIPARGQWRSALRRGGIPVFDDIDFARLNRFITANSTALATALGPDGPERLQSLGAQCGEAVRSWQEAEPRIWGRLASRTYTLLDWKGAAEHLVHALDGAERAGEVFMSQGIARWEAEGRLAPSDAALLRNRLASNELRGVMHHLGAHLVISVSLILPIPGLRSAARFGWTFVYWAKSQMARLRPGHLRQTNSSIHTPLVMALSLVPALGAAAYMAAPPLRQGHLARILADQTASKLPFHLYRRLHLSNWLATPQQHAIQLAVAKDGTPDRRFNWRPGRVEFLAFLLLAGLLSLLTYFGVTTDRQPWDLPITKYVQRLDLDRFGPFSQAIFWMGLRGFAGVLLVVVAGALWLKGQRPAAIFMVFIGFFDLINVPLRDLIDRPRPTPDLVGVVIGYGGVQGSSFPSGHSLHTLLFYGFLIYLARRLMKPGLLRTGIWTLLGTYILIAGLWLVYDGRHWPSDVLGGYVYGAFYLLLLIAGFRAYLVWRERFKAALPTSSRPSTPMRVLRALVRKVG